MKKRLLSGFVFAASAIYVAYQYMSGNVSSTATTVADATQTAQSPIATTVDTSTSSTQTTSTPTPTQTPTPVSTPVVTPTPVPVVTKPKGQYADGTYTGSAVDAYYGMVQVQAVVQNGALATVTFLQYPSDRRTSQQLNNQVMPILKSEAIKAQSANVSGVSGATHTSEAFIQSLGDALAQAKNS